MVYEQGMAVKDYCTYMGYAVSNFARKIQTDTSVIFPQEQSVYEGNVLAIGGGAALTLAEAKRTSCLKTEIAAEILLNGGYFFGRAHGQIDTHRLPHIGQALSKAVVDWLIKDPNVSMGLDQTSSKQCAALGWGDGHPGIRGAISGLESFTRQLAFLVGSSEIVDGWLERGQLDLGVEIPGGVVIRSLSKKSPDSEFIIEPDIPLLVRYGIMRLDDEVEESKINQGKWLICVDERVDFKQNLKTLFPIQTYPHAPVAVAIFDIDDPDQRSFAIASSRLQQPDKNYELGVMTSGCIGYLGPIEALSVEQKREMLRNMALLYWYVKTSYTFPSVYETAEARKVQRAFFNESTSPQIFETPQQYSWISGRLTPIPIIVKKGILTPDELRYMQKIVNHEALWRSNIPVIEL